MHKTYTDYALFMGWFYNPKEASRIAKQNNPDYETSDDEFEQSYDLVENYNKFKEARKHRRMRKVIE